MPSGLTFKINPGSDHFHSLRFHCHNSSPCFYPGPSCPTFTISQNRPIKMKPDMSSSALNTPLAAISLRGKAEVLTVAYKVPHRPCGPYFTPSSLISPATCLLGPSRHKVLLKFLQHAGASTPGPLHCCLLLLECSPSREPVGWLPPYPADFHRTPCLNFQTSCPFASTAIFIFLLRP